MFIYRYKPIKTDTTETLGVPSTGPQSRGKSNVVSRVTLTGAPATSSYCMVTVASYFGCLFIYFTQLLNIISICITLAIQGLLR